MRAIQRATQVYMVHKHRPTEFMISLGIDAVRGEFNQEELHIFVAHLRRLANQPVYDLPVFLTEPRVINLVAPVNIPREEDNTEPVFVADPIEQEEEEDREPMTTVLFESDNARRVPKTFPTRVVTYCKYNNAVIVESESGEYILSYTLLRKYMSTYSDDDSVVINEFSSHGNMTYKAGIKNILVQSDTPCCICMEYAPHHACTTDNCSAVYCDSCYHKLSAIESGDNCALCRRILLPKWIVSQD